jgi:Ca2+-binding RTX toxin-like protein
MTIVYSFDSSDYGGTGAFPYTDAGGDLFFQAKGDIIELANGGTVTNPSYSNPIHIDWSTYGDSSIPRLEYVYASYPSNTYPGDPNVYNGLVEPFDNSIIEALGNTTIVNNSLTGPYTTLFSFGDNNVGDISGIDVDGAYNIWGSTTAGGAYGLGMIFEISGAIAPPSSPVPPHGPPPTIAGAVPDQTTTAEAPVEPFAHVTVRDANAGATDTLTITLGGAGGTLSGMGLSGGVGGVYALSGTASAVTSELEALLFTPSAGAPNSSSTTTFTLSDQSSAYATPIVDGATSVIDSDPTGAPTIVGTVGGQTTTSEAPVDQPVAVNGLAPPPLLVQDTTLNQALTPSIEAYTGPVAGIQHQYINTGADSFNITAATPNWFIHSGSGNDAIAVSSGTNVLDGGAGSNFLTGGSGADTFFVDDRGPTADIWSTVNNFHAGDAATIWGVTPQDHSLDWVDGQGAAGYTGLTLHATAPGLPTASLTLVGFTQSDLHDGRLSVSFGSSNGSSYMYVHDNS